MTQYVLTIMFQLLQVDIYVCNVTYGMATDYTLSTYYFKVVGLDKNTSWPSNILRSLLHIGKLVSHHDEWNIIIY